MKPIQSHAPLTVFYLVLSLLTGCSATTPAASTATSDTMPTKVSTDVDTSGS